MKKILFTVLLLSAAPSLFAQLLSYHYKNEKHVYTNSLGRVINMFPDSIRIEIPDERILIVLEARNYRAAVSALDGLALQLKGISDVLAKSHITKPDCKAHVVRQTTDLNDFRNIDITEVAEPASRVRLQKDQLLEILPPGWEIFMEENNYKLFVYCDDPEKIGKVLGADILLVREKLDATRSYAGGRKSVKSRFILRNHSLAFDEIRYYHPLDMVSLSLGTGVGVLRNRVYPEIVGYLGFYIADRFNRHSHRIEASYSSNYFGQLGSENVFHASIASFAGISYAKNFGRNDPFWLGVGGSYLVSQTGDFNFFQGKTMKFYLISTMGTGKFSIMPEFYLTNDLKSTQFGLKMNYRF
jgi:hypothetical protein